MGEYGTILFGESGTETSVQIESYGNILFGDTTQPAEVPAGSHI